MAKTTIKRSSKKHADKKKIVLIYVGKRYDPLEGNLYNAFQKEGEKQAKELMFAHMQGYWIGNRYEGFEQDGITSLSRTRLDKDVEDEVLLEIWRGRSLAAEEMAAKNRAQAKADKLPLSPSIIEALQRATSKLTTREKDAFLTRLKIEVIDKPQMEEMRRSIRRSAEKQARHKIAKGKV